MFNWDFALRAFGVLMIVLLGLSALVLVTALLSYLVDQWRWNGGICRDNGQPWQSTLAGDGTVLLVSGGIRARVGRWVLSEEYLK